MTKVIICGINKLYHLRHTDCFSCLSSSVRKDIITVAGPELTSLSPTDDGAVLVIAMRN